MRRLFRCREFRDDLVGGADHAGALETGMLISGGTEAEVGKGGFDKPRTVRGFPTAFVGDGPFASRPSEAQWCGASGLA
jgi:hypothetical protein